MKRQLQTALSIFLGGALITLSAAPRDLRSASLIANNRLGTECSLVSYGNNTRSGNKPYYIFNADNGEGFSIVSGDDRLPEILGYSLTGTFDKDNLPPQLEWLLSYYTALAESDEAPLIVKETRAAKPVLIKTANWGQNAPYNNLCPSNTLTGCGATAMAILMNHYKYPSQGKGSHAYRHNGKRLSCNFSQPIDWDNMLDDYSGSYSEVQAEAVAKLMYSCGVLLEMNYSPVESTSFASKSCGMAKHFGYEQGVEYVEKESYGISDEKWLALINDELDRGNPMMYRGANHYNQGGHIFILDGRDDSGNFHINWGWDGQLNGYYNLARLTPNNSNYTFYQGMVVNTRPSKTPDETYSEMWISAQEGGKGLVVNRDNIKGNDPFYASVSRFQNRDIAATQMGEVAVALIDEKGEIVEIASQGDFELSPTYAYTTYSFPGCQISRDALLGERLALVYRQKGEFDWRFVPAGLNTVASVPATGHSPEYAQVKWSVDPRIKVLSTNSQHLDKALKYARYDFYIDSDDPEVTSATVTINGKRINPSNGWYTQSFVNDDKLDIKIVGYPEPASVDGITDNDNIPHYVYTIDGMELGVFENRDAAMTHLRNLGKGVYIIRFGNQSEKVIGGQ